MPRCPLCTADTQSLHARARDIEYFTSDRDFEFYRCQDCEVLFVHPMLADDLTAIYPSNYYSFKAGRRTLAISVKEWLDRRRFRKTLGALPGSQLAVLDVGGGTGWMAKIAKSADPRVSRTHIVDIDPNAASAARSNGHEYTLSRFEEFESEERFDLILMLNLIEHVSDPRAILQKARSLLTDHGRVLIKTPNFDSLDARIFRHRSWAGYHTPRHFVLFNRGSFDRLCGQCGLQAADFAYTQGAPFWSVSLLDELRRLGLVTVSREHPAIYHPLIPVLQIACAAFDFARRPFAQLSQMEISLGVPVKQFPLTLAAES